MNQLVIAATTRLKPSFDWALQRHTTTRSCPGEMKMMLPPSPCAERISRRSWPLPLLRVQPPQESVVGPVRARRRRHLDVGRGDDLLVAPLAVSQPQQPEPRHVVTVDPRAAAPPRAARDRRHPLAVNIDVRVRIWHPLPRRRRADGIHHLVAKYVGNRPLENTQQRQRKAVHAHVVVFVVRAGRSNRARLHLGGAECLASDEVGVLAPHLAFPLRVLLKMVAPCHAAVLGRIVPAVLHHLRDGVVEIRNQPAIERDTRDCREHALRDAVCRIRTKRISELRDDVAAADDQAGAAAALGGHRGEQLAHVDFLVRKIAPGHRGFVRFMNSTASFSFAASMPTSAGVFRAQSPGGG